MLAIAKELGAMQAEGKLQGNKNIIIAAWSGEELGVLGSTYYVNHVAKTSEIDAVINLDMVGHLQDKLVLQGIGSSPDWPKLLQPITQSTSLSFVMQQDPYLPTDTTPFYLHQIPTINCFSGAQDTYHTPRDTADSLNYQGMQYISSFLLHLIIALEHHRKLTFHAVAKTHQMHQQAFKVYLGTIPDYASDDIVGVKLSGVVKGSPAEQARLGAQDIIIRLNGKPIQNIHDYSKTLYSLHPNDRVTIIALRKQREKTFNLIASAR